MTKFYIEVLAKAKIGHKSTDWYQEEKIITTTLIVNGTILRAREQIGAYTRYEESYEYDILEAKPLANDEFETIGADGQKSDFYMNRDYEIKEILEIFAEKKKYTED